MYAQNTPTSSGTKSSPMDYAKSMVSHNDYTVSLTVSDDHITDIPTKNCGKENCTQLSKKLSKRSQAASRRSKRLSESLRSLQSWESGKSLDNEDSSDFDFDDGLRDSIYLTKERMKSAHMMCDDEGDLKNPAPVKQESAKGMVPMHNWKNTTCSPTTSQLQRRISKAA